MSYGCLTESPFRWRFHFKDEQNGACSRFCLPYPSEAKSVRRLIDSLSFLSFSILTLTGTSMATHRSERLERVCRPCSISQSFLPCRSGSDQVHVPWTTESHNPVDHMRMVYDQALTHPSSQEGECRSANSFNLDSCPLWSLVPKSSHACHS